jgi:anti-sigma B factor antagonist
MSFFQRILGGPGAPRRLPICLERTGDINVVIVDSGNVDQATSTAIKQAVRSLAQPGAQVVLDLERIQIIDSYGCGAIVACVRHLRSNGGELAVCGLTPALRALFELVRMHQVLDIFNTRAEAIRSIEAIRAGTSNLQQVPCE